MNLHLGCLLPLALLTISCAPPLVDWSDVTPVGEEAPAAAKLRLVADGRAEFMAAPVASFEAENACPGSLVYARGGGNEWYAAWWSPNQDGSVVLFTARSDDGGVSWSTPAAADVRDRGARACERPAPGIAADSAAGYVHLVYWMEPRGEQGIWYSHSMERGELWHAPVAVMFGTDPARASVAASGETVAIAYEHPNAAEGRIGLAVSHSAGHIIDGRTLASTGNAYAERPLVAVRGRDVAVAWTAREPSRHVVLRRGRLGGEDGGSLGSRF